VFVQHSPHAQTLSQQSGTMHSQLGHVSAVQQLPTTQPAPQSI
jgi:hypothetical protein